MQHNEQQPKPDRDTLTAAELQEIKKTHQDASDNDLKLLISLPRISLVNFALSEKSAKNKVYYFIFEHQLFDKFVEYCRTH